MTDAERVKQKLSNTLNLVEVGDFLPGGGMLKCKSPEVAPCFHLLLYAALDVLERRLRNLLVGTRHTSLRPMRKTEAGMRDTQSY